MDREPLQDPIVRVAAMENNFPLFMAFHYGREFTPFQIARMRSMQSDLSTMIVAFRASRKTTIVRAFVVRCIVYKKEPSIVWQSYEIWLSAESVREIAKMLCQRSIVADYGMLFPMSTKKMDMAKSSFSNFETTNWVKVASKSLGQTLRWANTYDAEAEMSARPTLLILDDIDITKSVNNVDIINQNEQKIKTETIGALDPLRRKIIFLGNVIHTDWVVPRFRRTYGQAKWRNCYRQPLIDGKWVNCRPEVFTESVVSTLWEDGKISMQQNYLLIPTSSWSGIFTLSYFDRFLTSRFEQEDGILKKQDLTCWLFIDPAFSTAKKSDNAVVIWVWEHQTSKKKYLINWYADTSAPSRTIAAVIVMINNMTMDWFPPKFISVESVSINKQQTAFVKLLKDELIRHEIYIPVYVYESKVPKEQRIKDNCEAPMSQQGLKINRNISQSFLAKLETQFLEFPNSDYDDIPDTVAQMFEVFRKKGPWVKEWESQVVEVDYNLTWR